MKLTRLLQVSAMAFTFSLSVSSFAQTVHTSAHLGFDMSRVATTSQMTTWWKFSPYYDTGIYLPGSANRTNDPNLTSSWVSTIKGQGWGIIPIWFGLQAPCANDQTLTQFSSVIATAQAQATSEAQSAATSASNLGLSQSVIYKDLEAYSTSNSTCDAAVTAYVGAWVTKLHALGYSAGVYANSAGAEQNVSQASPRPDEIWVAAYDGRATIWAIGTLDDALWPTDQRIHQYLNYKSSNPPPLNTGEAYGGVSFSCPNSCIDRDIEEAPVTGGNLTKSYSSWAATTLDDPSFTDIVLTGVNDANMGQTLPQFSGEAFDGAAPGLFWDPIKGWTAFSVGPGVWSVGTNNDQGFVVGGNYTTTGKISGYLTNPLQGNQPVNINFPGARDTFPSAINDVGEIVGYYDDASFNEYGFLLDDKGIYHSLNYPGTFGVTVAQGINGQGVVTGYYYSGANGGPPSLGFTYSVADGWKTVTLPNCPVNSNAGGAQFGGVNNNGQTIAECNVYQAYGVSLFDLAHSTMVPFPLCGGCLPPAMANDDAFLAGGIYGSDNHDHGTYWTPSP